MELGSEREEAEIAESENIGLVEQGEMDWLAVEFGPGLRLGDFAAWKIAVGGPGTGEWLLVLPAKTVEWSRT